MLSVMSEQRELMQAADRQHRETQNERRTSVPHKKPYPEAQQQGQKPDTRNNKKRWNRNRGKNRQAKGKKKLPAPPHVTCLRHKGEREQKDCPRANGTCFICQQHGHFAAECPQRIRPSLGPPGLSLGGPSNQHREGEDSQLRISKGSTKKQKVGCTSCGRSHGYEDCLIPKGVCFYCGQQGHIAKNCSRRIKDHPDPTKGDQS